MRKPFPALAPSDHWLDWSYSGSQHVLYADVRKDCQCPVCHHWRQEQDERHDRALEAVDTERELYPLWERYLSPSRDAFHAERDAQLRWDEPWVPESPDSC